jgi:cobalt-zinc-cadmium efflux system protein
VTDCGGEHPESFGEEQPHQHGGRDGVPGHSHAISSDADSRYIAVALALIVAFLIFEVVMAFVGHSLALLADAGHMLTDAGALAAGLLAFRLSKRPAGGVWTFGFKRAEVLSAQANGITLLVVSALVAFEAITRLVHPVPVTGGIVVAVAAVGVAVNVAATLVIARASRDSINVKGAFAHILTDLYAFIGTLIAGIVIIVTGFVRADAIASLVVVALMAKAGIGLLHKSGRIFLEAAPPELSPDAIGRAMAAREGVVEVHDLHIWQITSGMPAASAHVLVGPGLDCHAVRVDLERLLADTYRIDHTTLQVDHAPDPLLTIRRGTPAPPGDGHCPQAHGPAHHHRDSRG